MSIPNLPVNFKDDILNTSSNSKRKYNLVYNSDGTVSLEDVTVYSQKGSSFGAAQVNKTNTAINNIYSQRMLDLEDVELVNQTGFFVDALAVKELNSKISDLYTYKNLGTNRYGYKTPLSIVLIGTIVRDIPSAEYVKLWTASDILSMLQELDPSIKTLNVQQRCVLSTCNGDADTANIRYYEPEWWETNNAYYQYFYHWLSHTTLTSAFNPLLQQTTT